MRIMSIAAFIAITISTGAAIAEDDTWQKRKEGMYILGAGTFECRDAIEKGFFFGDTIYFQSAKSWLSGYITSANRFLELDRTGNLSNNTSIEERWAYMQLHCGKCPADTLEDAAFSLVTILGLKQNKYSKRFNILSVFNSDRYTCISELLHKR